MDRLEPPIGVVDPEMDRAIAPLGDLADGLAEKPRGQPGADPGRESLRSMRTSAPPFPTSTDSGPGRRVTILGPSQCDLFAGPREGPSPGCVPPEKRVLTIGQTGEEAIKADVMVGGNARIAWAAGGDPCSPGTGTP